MTTQSNNRDDQYILDLFGIQEADLPRVVKDSGGYKLVPYDDFYNVIDGDCYVSASHLTSSMVEDAPRHYDNGIQRIPIEISPFGVIIVLVLAFGFVMLVVAAIEQLAAMGY